MTGDENNNKQVTNFAVGPFGGGGLIQVNDVAGGIKFGGPPPKWGAEDVPHLGQAIADTLLSSFGPEQALSLLSVVQYLHDMGQETRDSVVEAAKEIISGLEDRANSVSD